MTAGANPGDSSPLLGLILCGGKSKRMGRDKGLILKDGPLNGLFTAHRRYPAKDILMLACDMLDMDQVTLQHLTDAYNYNTIH